ncbi:MAG: serine/threonine protein kinase [Planctomycetaceae bacterium]|nr:serine/threonine protein kinase [Planctomycetaceae bacterium]
MTAVQSSSGHDSPADRIDSLCDAFESRWRAGEQPRIEDFLVLAPESNRSVLLHELLAVERECRQQSSAALGLDEALRRFPQDATLVRELFEKPASEVDSVFAAEQTSLPAGSSPSKRRGQGHTDPRSTVTWIRDIPSDSATRDSASTPDTLPRQRFGDYELLHEIARGGMGVVYKARQLKLNRVVALKMILAGELASPEAIERFRTEAQAAANLDHRGIVPIYEVGEINGLHFFSMGFVEGPSLATRLREQPLTSRAAVEIVIEIAEAIDYAHQNGIIHRDLKPQNILLTLEVRTKIKDF